METALEALARDAAALGGFALLVVRLRAVDGIVEPGREAVVAAGPLVAGLGRAARIALLEVVAPPAGLRSVVARLQPRRRPSSRAIEQALAGRLDAPRFAEASIVFCGRRVGAVRLFAAHEAPSSAAAEALAARVAELVGRVQERRELQRQRAAYKAFLDRAGDAVLIVDPVSGRVREANLRALELTGRSLTELRRSPLSTLFLRARGQLRGGVARPGGPVRAIVAHLSERPVVRDDELQLVPRDRAPLPVSVTASTMEAGGDAVLHLVVRDLTSERAALTALAQAKETVAALALAGAALVEETEHSRIFQVIARELGRLGLRATVLVAHEADRPFEIVVAAFPADALRMVERILGEPFVGRRIDPTDAPLLAQTVERGTTSFTERPLELLRAAFGQGLPREALARAAAAFGVGSAVLAPLRWDGRVAGVLVVTAPSLGPGDVEAIDAFARAASIALERARLEQRLRLHSTRLESEVDRRTRELQLAVRALREVDRRKDAFLANVSHELRTPLVSVLGWTEIVLSGKLGPLDGRQEQALASSLAAGRRLRDFLEQLLDFSRHELTREQMKLGRIDVRGPIHAAVEQLLPKTLPRGIVLRVRVASNTPAALGDEGRLVQVFTNLLANAERYCAEGGRIWIAAARGRAGLVEISVSDDGAGIAEEHLAHVFDRLWQAGDVGSDRQKGAGIGLGLAIVRSIVDAHGGRIEAHLRRPRGARFVLTLPPAGSGG